MNVDCSEYTMELYVEYILSYIFEDEYSLIDINYDTNKAHIERNSDMKTMWVELEKITNKKVELFR